MLFYCKHHWIGWKMWILLIEQLQLKVQRLKWQETQSSFRFANLSIVSFTDPSLCVSFDLLGKDPTHWNYIYRKQSDLGNICFFCLFFFACSLFIWTHHHSFFCCFVLSLGFPEFIVIMLNTASIYGAASSSDLWGIHIGLTDCWSVFIAPQEL